MKRLTEIPKAKSELEELLALQIRALGIEAPQREYPFAPPRRWRFDFAWPDIKLAAEVEGGIHSRGRHVRASGFAADAEKYNHAALQWWTVLRFTSQSVRSGHAVSMIRTALALRRYAV